MVPAWMRSGWLATSGFRFAIRAIKRVTELGLGDAERVSPALTV